MIGVAKNNKSAQNLNGIFVWDPCDTKNERVLLYSTAAIVSELFIAHAEGTNSTEITFIEEQVETSESKVRDENGLPCGK